MEKDKQFFNDLEELLQNQANNFAIYPKDTTWEDIKTELHGTPKWPALGIIFMCIIVALTISTALNYPPEPILAKYKTEPKNNSIQSQTSNNKKSYKTFTQQLNTKANNEETFAKSNSNIPVSIENGDNLVLTDNELIDLNRKTNNNKENNIVIATNAANSYNLNHKQESHIELFNETHLEVINNLVKPVEILKSNESNDLNINFIGSENNNPEASDYLSEFVANKYLKPKKPSKWQYQLYITPSISDRILFDDKTRIYYTNPTTSSQNLSKNVNDVIQYTPAMGTEIGASFMYKVGKNLHLKTGFQFNIRQYFIDAYRGFNTATVAFVNNSALDSINLISLFSNNKNSHSTELNNKLYQFSIPVGIQWDFLSINNFGVNIAATIQPTFTLNKNVYLVSTDYKYFADGESFFRNINLNSAVELNFTFKTGQKQWFFGPQLRYQHLPTFNKIYPIKEFRLDYGLRFGFNAPL
jgi:hypothetical protein